MGLESADLASENLVVYKMGTIPFGPGPALTRLWALESVSLQSVGLYNLQMCSLAATRFGPVLCTESYRWVVTTIDTY